LDDYLKVSAVFDKKVIAQNFLGGAQNGRFRNHIIQFLTKKATERYEVYEDFFEGADRDLSLAYHFGGVLTIIELVLDNEIIRSPKETALFLAKSKLHIRGLPKQVVDETMSSLERMLN